jgi:LysR family glycine cleavage system transcriptional activator
VSGPIFGDASLMLDAAANGQGVALARSVLVDHDLALGRLVRLGEAEVASDRAYFAVCSPAARARPEVGRFLDWLVASSRRPAKPRANLAAVR